MKEVLWIALSTPSTITAAPLSDLYRNHDYSESLRRRIKDQANCAFINTVPDK